MLIWKFVDYVNVNVSKNKQNKFDLFELLLPPQQISISGPKKLQMYVNLYCIMCVRVVLFVIFRTVKNVTHSQLN